MRPAAGGVLFFQGDAVTGAHGFALDPPAFAYAHTTHGGMREIAMIFRKLKVSFRTPGLVISAQAQIFIDAIGLNHLVRVHLVLQIPDGLELAEGLHQLRAKHLGQQLGT